MKFPTTRRRFFGLFAAAAAAPVAVKFIPASLVETTRVATTSYVDVLATAYDGTMTYKRGMSIVAFRNMIMPVLNESFDAAYEEHRGEYEALFRS